MCASPMMLTTGCAGPQADPIHRFPLSEMARHFDLPAGAPCDPALQADLIALDDHVAAALGIPADARAFGVIDLSGPRVAMIRPDQRFYGASLPKIAIVWAYLLDHHEDVAQPHPERLRELQSIIKRSDNDLAAKYSQWVGLERIQSLLQSPPYQLYDQNSGGGLWCGKHYGIAQPRRGDPLGDLSHAATVRQTLRYYLLLEQDRLGGPTVCARLREVFAAPWAEYHDDYFVAGLKGLGLNLIRKNGLWSDWHLDSARVELPDRAVLLAGMVHHSRGPEYLARVARALVIRLRGAASVDAAMVEAEAPPNARARHATILHDTPEAFASAPVPCDARGFPRLATTGRPADFESAPLDFPMKFDELTISWNIESPPRTGFRVELRVGRRFDNYWSPWLTVGDGGAVAVPAERVVKFDGGRIDIDFFRSAERFDRAAYRVRAVGDGGFAESPPIGLRRIALCASDGSGMPDSWTPVFRVPSSPPAERWMRRLPVPFRSQKTERRELAGRICSPTSLSMVLAYHGIERTTQQVADACHDPLHGIYGNWPRNIQAAYELGVPGYLTRFSHWAEVETHIAEGRPIIASIRFKRDEAIPNAPYHETDGHLVVICGFDGAGGVHVNDPAVPDLERGALIYARKDLERVWFGNTGGVAYVLHPPDETASIR